MALAIRTATRLQDQDDVNVTLAAGVDGYALTYDHPSGEFVLTAIAAGTGDLVSTNNLSDVANVATARTNLGLVAAGAGDIWVEKAGDTMTGALILSGSTTGAGQDVNYLSWYDAGGTKLVAKLSVVSTDASQDDGNLVVSLATNGALAERFRIPRDGSITLASDLMFIDNNTRIRRTGSGTMRMDNRVSIEFYEALNDRIYAYFHRNTFAYISPYSALTNTTQDTLRLIHNSSGVTAAGFGEGLLFALQSSTTTSQRAASITALWNEATHATRKADLVLSAYDTAEREGLRIRGAGAAAAIGFYGVAPVARQVLATGVGATVDQVITALQNLGLLAQA